MPRNQDAYWIGFQATAAEKQILENYCQETQQSKTQVLRDLIITLDDKPNEKLKQLMQAKVPWKADIQLKTQDEIQPYLQSLFHEAEQDLAIAHQLRTMGEQLLAIAKVIEDR